MTETLKDLRVGESGRVTGYDPAGKVYRRRLLAMGLTRGTSFSVTRLAPMGDPVEIRVRGFALTLRREEASSLFVEKIES